MGLLNRLKILLGIGDSTPYGYRCSTCGTDFEASDGPLKDVRCPVCDSKKVRRSSSPSRLAP